MDSKDVMDIDQVIRQDPYSIVGRRVRYEDGGIGSPLKAPYSVRVEGAIDSISIGRSEVQIHISGYGSAPISRCQLI
jgi:hypothetical protein